MGRHRRSSTAAVLIALAVAFGGLAIWEYWQVRSTWSDLRRVAEEFDPPAGFGEVARQELGTAFCWFSCDEARIDLILEVDPAGAHPRERCHELVPALTDVSGVRPRPPPEDLSGCLVSSLPPVGSSAYVQVGASSGGPSCTITVEACVIVTFNSGIN